MRALIIDDEPDAIADLRLSLGDHAVEVLGAAETLAAAKTLLARDDYDIVFLDVQLRGGTGFDLVPHVRTGTRIIFVTAHDQYALRAFEVNALDYLLKPVSSERLQSSLARVSSARANTTASEQEDNSSVQLRPDDIVYLRTGTQGRFVPLRDISTIEADQNYSIARLNDGTRMMLRRTLKSWEDILPPSHFMRVHRTAFVNLERIARYERDRDERTLLYLAGAPEPIPVARSQWSELQSRLGTLHRVV